MTKSFKYYDLLIELVRTDFKIRYNNSLLGFTWVILKPLLLFSILYIVFSHFFGASDPHYRLNLLLGLIIFNFFSESTTRGLLSLYERCNIILKVKFPRYIAVLAPIINSFINFCINWIIFFIFWCFTPTDITIYWLLIPYYIFILLILVLGISWFTCILFIYFRDLVNLWEVLISLLFYLTPVIYPFQMIPIQYQKLFILNPITTIILDIRSIIILNQSPSLFSMIYSSVFSLIIFFSGYYFFQSKIQKIAEKY